MVLPRPPCIHHCTSLPYRFFGRTAELTLLDQALADGEASLLAFIGPGGQGKTAIVQHWLESLGAAAQRPDGLFLWSFYRGKDADLCLRELYTYALRLPQVQELSASYCVDQLLPLLRQERWALVLDGTEVAQYEAGPWFGRFLHPELGRLLEELAGAPLPGVVVVTTRFPLPQLEHRRHVRLLSLGTLDPVSARDLLTSFGVRGSPAELDEAAAACASHAKAVELLATYLVRFCQGEAHQHRELPEAPGLADASDEETKVARVLLAYQATLPGEAQDILALATAFRDPPREGRLLEYLASQPVRALLHEKWGRDYVPFAERASAWLAAQLHELVELRLLERVRLTSAGIPEKASAAVIDAHPLVRRAFEHALGVAGRRHSAQARAGFLRGRPGRRRPATLEQAREEFELFHAHCDAGLWNEADSTYVALENPKHRFLAPALERDLLLRFFHQGDWRQRPLWAGFGRYRSLAICFELLGRYEEAVAAYRETDAALRGDALLALGRLEPLLAQSQVPAPWNTLWQAYRAHALCLAGRTDEALALARTLVPVDVYEWLHVFECLLRTDQLATLDLESVLYRQPHTEEHRWSELARQRMRADYLRLGAAPQPDELGLRYEKLLDEYERSGLPLERALTRLGYATWLLTRGQFVEAGEVNAQTLELATRYQMRILAADAWHLEATVAQLKADFRRQKEAATEELRLRAEVGYRGPARP